MNKREKRHDTGEPSPSAADSTKGKKSLLVIPGTKDETAEIKTPKFHVVWERDGVILTVEEWKQRFAANLHRLIRLVGLTRKNAAREIGVPYKLIRRLVSSGVSRTDERTIGSLTKISRYFALPSVEDLWREDLIQRVLSKEQGDDFIEKFRQTLSNEWLSRLHAARGSFYDEELELLGRLFGSGKTATSSLTGEYADRVAIILSSPKADNFKRIIDDYYELVR